MAAEVAGSIPVSHPLSEARRRSAAGNQRSVAQLVEHRSPKPGVAGSIPAGPVRAILPAGNTALSSRGLGHSPLKAGTRVRIPLALFDGWIGPIVYRLGRDPFKVERRVRFPLGLSRRVALGVEVVRQWMWSWGCSSAWLECRSVTPEVAGSSPVSPVGTRGNRE